MWKQQVSAVADCPILSFALVAAADDGAVVDDNAVAEW